MPYDPAVIDFMQWYNWKQAKGIYMVTQAKVKMALLRCGKRNIHRHDPRNNAVVSEELRSHGKSTIIPDHLLSHATSWRPAIDEMRPLMAQYMTRTLDTVHLH